MRIEELESFVAVCEYGTFTKAAEMLHFSQPVVTRHVRSLESSLGYPLFVRTTRDVRQTPEGKMLLPYAKHALEELKEGTAAIEALHNDQARSLSVGFGFLYLDNLTSSLYEQFKTEHPTKEISLIERETSELIRNVDEGSVDAAIVGLTDMSDLPPHTERMIFAQLPENIIVGKSHPLAHHSSLAMDDIAGESFIYPHADPTPISSVVRADLMEAGLEAHIEMASYEKSALRMIELGEGILDLPSPFIPQDADVVAIPYESNKTITYGIIWNSANSNTLLAEFIEYMQGRLDGIQQDIKATLAARNHHVQM